MSNPVLWGGPNQTSQAVGQSDIEGDVTSNVLPPAFSGNGYI